MSGPQLQTTTLDKLLAKAGSHFPLQFVAIQVCYWHALPACLEQEINPVHATHCRSLPRGQSTSLKKLEREQQLALTLQCLARGTCLNEEGF
jgi:hypothetical protein